MKKKNKEQISWKGLEEKNFKDLGVMYFNPEDLFKVDDIDDQVFLGEYEISLDTRQPKKYVTYGQIE